MKENRPKFIAKFMAFFVENPVYLFLLLPAAILLLVFSLVRAQFGLFQKLAVILGLYILSTVSTIPDRFRGFVSFRVGMMADMLVAIAYGVGIGVVFTMINVATNIFVSKKYELGFVLRVILLSPIFLAALPNFLGANPANLSFICLVCMLLLFLVIVPMSFFMSGGNLPRIIISGIFNIYWQYLLISIYGVRILELLTG